MAKHIHSKGVVDKTFLRFILSNNIAVDCIFRGEYPNICLYALNNIPAPHTYKLVYAPAQFVFSTNSSKIAAVLCLLVVLFEIIMFFFVSNKLFVFRGMSAMCLNTWIS